jgi:hypothetical protein
MVGASRQRPGSEFVGDDTSSVTGTFMTAADYPGCPSCGASNFATCGKCARLSCYDDTWPEFHCGSCGNSGPITGHIQELRSLGAG